MNCGYPEAFTFHSPRGELTVTRYIVRMGVLFVTLVVWYTLFDKIVRGTDGI